MEAMTKILECVIATRQGDFSPEHARYVLTLGFSPEQKARHEQLAYKAQGMDITPTERLELEQFVGATTLLMLLQSKARVSLKRHAEGEFPPAG